MAIVRPHAGLVAEWRSPCGTKLYRTSERQDWCARSWLADTVGAYLQELADRGYRDTTLRIYADNLFRYGEFLGQRGTQSLAALPDWIETFLSKGNQRIECVRNRRSHADRVHHVPEEAGPGRRMRDASGNGTG